MNNKGNPTAEKNKSARKIASYIILSIFAAFNVCFFLPMDIYMANANDIDIPIKPLAAYLGLVTLGVFIVTFLICLLTKGKANRVFRAIVFGISMAFYIQGNFLAVKMGLLNGERYEVPAWKAALNIVIWLVILAAPFVILWKLPDEFDGLISRIPEAVILIQLIALGVSAYSNIPKYSAEKLDTILTGDTIPYCSASDLDLYSQNKNLLIIIADEYDSFLFDGAVKEAPDSVSEFDGFTYYTNTIGKYDLTIASIAYITSGGAYDESYKDLTFYRNAAANFKANFYSTTAIPPASVMSEFCDNVGVVKLSLGEAMEYSTNIYKLAFFRCMPEILKPLFWFNGENIGEGFEKTLTRKAEAENGAKLYDCDNLGFYNNLPRELVTTDKNVFKFIYFYGIHMPRSVTKDLERSENGLVSPEEEAIAVNRIINEYLKILKENSVYDNSEIIFMADHGHFDGKKYPLLMYKPANQTETGIKVSNAPISYDDIYPTLIKLSGGEPESRTIFDIAEDEERVRHFETTNVDITGNIKQDPAINPYGT